jgi:hypothetical protein
VLVVSALVMVDVSGAVYLEDVVEDEELEY